MELGSGLGLELGVQVKGPSLGIKSRVDGHWVTNHVQLEVKVMSRV